MKKLFAIVMSCVAAIVISSCTGAATDSNTPSGVAEKAMKCLQKKDYKGYVDLMDIKATDGSTVEQTKATYVAMLQNKFQEAEKKSGEMKDFQIVNEEIKDSTAVVKVAVNYDQKSDTTDVKLKLTEKDGWKLDAGK
ncbi:MAG: DUF4878 domain-containing protein [Prevotella sp.]|nr:DUF4878 domain-containing protein [Prevotella sp.]